MSIFLALALSGALSEALSGALSQALSQALAQDVAPSVLVPATPVYPATALAERITGTVVLRISVDAAGAVTASEVIQSVRADIDAAAIAASRLLQFTPALEDGVPLPATLDYAFSFALSVGDEQGNPVPGSVQIHVVDVDGLDVPGVRVVLTPVPSSQNPMAGVEPRTLTTGDGGLVRASFLAPGDWMLRLEKIGFAPVGAAFTIGPGETRAADLTLTPAGPREEIVVWGLKQRWRDVARAPLDPVLEPVTGSYVLTRRDVESTPGALEDVTRAVHKLPGVASDGDMLGTFSVRGATSDEVVFLLDRVPLDNPFHLAGFNSIFNPDMLAEVRFFAGAAPASYPTTTSAVMDVQSWDGAPRDDRVHDIDGAVDLSMSTARLLLMGPIGGDDLTFAFAARRSYLEAYFWAMKQFDLFDTAIAAPEYDELSARVAWKPGNHRFLLTLLRTSDHLALVDSEDESLITIDGTFALDDVVYLASLDHRVEFGEGTTLQSTVAYSWDHSRLERDFGGAVTRDTTRQQIFGRTDLGFSGCEGHHVDVGAAGQLRAYAFEGQVEDTRDVPPWAALPIGDTGRTLLTLDPRGFSPQVAAYAEHQFKGPVRTRLGVRGTWVGRTGEVLPSPTAGVSLPLPTGTVPKLSTGLYHHVVEDPLKTDPEYGNPDLRAERAWQLVVGADQALPIGKGGLLRVEGYLSRLEHLVVNPDTRAAVLDGVTYTNDGTGRNMGVDVLIAGRSERVQVAGTFSWLSALRDNPLNEVYADTYVPGHAQAVTAGLSVEYQLAPKWRLTGRYDFHTGRPISAVEPGGQDTLRLTVPDDGQLNAQRLGDFHQLDLRVEWREATARIRWSVYLEVLNVLYMRSDFLPTATVTDGTLEMGMLAHLPTRPFLGIRADF